MNLVIVALTIFVAWHRGVWGNWAKFNATMIYIAMCSLLYNFLYFGHTLWQIKPDFFSAKINDMLFTFILFPLAVLLLLSFSLLIVVIMLVLFPVDLTSI